MRKWFKNKNGVGDKGDRIFRIVSKNKALREQSVISMQLSVTYWGKQHNYTAHLIPNNVNVP